MDKFLVYGNPIAQSKSPIIHQMFAQQTKQAIHYDKCLSTSAEFEESVNKFILAGGKGANVTAPFKEQAMQMCDQLTERAKAAGAVNTLIFSERTIKGDNTDGVGLVNDLKNHQVQLTNKTILLMGAGGAARGVILPLLAENPKQIVIVNRTTEKAEQLAARFTDQKITAISYAETAKATFDVVINATSASLSANLPDLSSTCITTNTVCYDMVYGAKLSPFLNWCKKHKARLVIDGLGMLVGQAAESFYIWRNVRPQQTQVLAKLRSQLQGADK
ncbi:shikimate dehydrogenase [Thalassotalea psychrophila]|uniref:Shikimate dehydrogenase (NADP(+)) n=1 Tax=Thalassotalea psychrophila TaxID=3065647 RepID=A0ABY9TUM3_9GAMM|nr:shikimate dehydrogenase [Colwelliaceae bacterium SQ149]